MRHTGNRRRNRKPERGLVSRAASALGGLIARNPVIAGGSTAFLVTMAFVSANALWYQPQAHGHVFFRTRSNFAFHAVEHRPVLVSMPGRETRDPAATGTVRDDKIVKVQEHLRSLGLYDGPVDGIAGPQTRKAIGALGRLAGVSEGQNAMPPASPAGAVPPKEVAVAVPTPRPDPEDVDGTTTADIPANPPAVVPSSDIVRVQAGLKAFGNESIEIDGIVGDETRKAIREFQSLFHLPVTGEADVALVDKMRETGLIN